MSGFEVHFAHLEELKNLDKGVFHSEHELQIYKNKGELGQNTRLGNLFVKKIILQKLGLELGPQAILAIIDRLTNQGYGYGVPVIDLQGSVRQAWSEKFGSLPQVSLSHDQNRFAMALTTSRHPDFRVGLDILSLKKGEVFY